MSTGNNTAAAQTAQGDEAEFAEIMGELEKLQKEVDQKGGTSEVPSASAPKPDLKVVASNPEPMAASAPSQIQDFHAGASDDAALEETLGSFKDEDENEASLFAEGESEESGHDDEIVGAAPAAMPTKSTRGSVRSEAANAEGAMTMTLSGAMRLELRYAISDQSVYVSFEDQMLRIELNDGTEFKVPFHKKSK